MAALECWDWSQLLDFGTAKCLRAACFRRENPKAATSRRTPREPSMKYAIVIPDGCADEPQDSLGGKTPLQAAQKPNMDRIARMGVVGRSNNVPESLTPASDVATLSLFGYDPLVVYTGRSPLEAAAMGIKLGNADWAIRCNLVTVENGEMRDFTAGHITTEEGRQLIRTIDDKLSGPAPDDVSQLEFFPGVSYRHCLVYEARPTAPFSSATKTQPPHDIPDRPIAEHLPTGPGSELLRSLMEASKPILERHPVNAARRKAGKRPAAQIWLWGQGKAAALEAVAKVCGTEGEVIGSI